MVHAYGTPERIVDIKVQPARYPKVRRGVGVEVISYTPTGCGTETSAHRLLSDALRLPNAIDLVGVACKCVTAH